jgi:hypothetical protein
MVVTFLAVVAPNLKARLFWLGVLFAYFFLVAPLLHWMSDMFTMPHSRPLTPIRLPGSITIK